MAAVQLPLAVALVVAVIAGCSGSGAAGPVPPGSSGPRSSAPVSPTASPTFEPKPGGTLRIAGVEKQVSLDPAAAATSADPAADLDGSAPSDATRLIGRLVLRQLYAYPASDPVHPATGAAPATGPQADLASGAPALTDGGLTATISLRAARWDVANPRRVTANDVLRALKRLCLPTVASPVRGYFAESVVGYAAGCRSIARTPPRTLAALDAVTIDGLAAQGDTALMIKLLRPTNDLTAMLALPETSPLPEESFEGLTVTSNPLRFVGDGPYRFVATQSGETYAFSRSPSWGADPLRRAYVDHVSVRGGLTAAQVRAELADGDTDLALDVPAAPTTVRPETPTPQLVDNPSRAALLLVVGSRGPGASRLAVPGVRKVLAACIDDATRRRTAAILGAGVATASADLAAGLSQVPAGAPAPSPSVSASGEAGGTRSSGSADPTPTATPSAAPTAASTAAPSGRVLCRPTLGVAGAGLRLLVPDQSGLRRVAQLLVARLKTAGVTVTVFPARGSRLAALTRAGDWDLLLDARPIAYPQPRALLAPLLDPQWQGGDAVPALRASQSVTGMQDATAATTSEAALAAWKQLLARLSSSATLLPLADLGSLYATGSNVVSAPVVATLDNADPVNVSLGSTRPSEPARSAAPTP